MKFKIGTRGSKLAVAQAEEVKRSLLNINPDLNIEIVKIITTGDKILDRNLSDIGGKGLFTQEIEESLEANELDIAVHSLKDMPITFPEGLGIFAVLPREDTRDAFISLKYKSIKDLPNGAIIGTASARRKVQLLNIRPDLNIVPFRGNIITRLEKLKDGVVDATILACAGLNRINITGNQPIPIETILPATGQGAICVECRSDNYQVIDMLKQINHKETEICTNTERAFLARLDGNCKTPIAGLAQIIDDQIHFKGMMEVEGKLIFVEKNGKITDSIKTGKEAADLILNTPY